MVSTLQVFFDCCVPHEGKSQPREKGRETAPWPCGRRLWLLAQAVASWGPTSVGVLDPGE